MLTLDKVYHAAFAMKEVVRRSDLIYTPSFSQKCGGEVYFKTENLQVTGSFKVRGAFYKISQLTEAERARGVIACSAGNHAQGVALAATRMGIAATICIPSLAPLSKVEATRAYGAQVELVKGVYDDAAARAAALQKETGATFIHPFDDAGVIAGQGTIGLEILEQLPETDAVIVPVGGGGLISGIAFAIKQLRPQVKIYGVQAQGAPSMAQSLAEKKRVALQAVSTVADGIAVKLPGELTYALCTQYVDKVVTVSDDEICAAILRLIESQKLITEGAGAVSAAAVLFDKLPLRGKKAVCVLSGGNIDVSILSRVITRGLIMAGRQCQLRLELNDIPGQLELVTHVISEQGGNIIDVDHNRTSKNKRATDCFLDVTIETRNHEHLERICGALVKNGVSIIQNDF